jgi:hypothetical protein
MMNDKRDHLIKIDLYENDDSICESDNIIINKEESSL